MEEKHKTTKRVKHHHRSRIGRTSNSNFLQQKRAMPYFKAKNKTKINNWKKKMEELEQKVDFDIVKDNFRHFFHLNLEDSVFDRELANLEHLFSPIAFWFLINDSYFQKNTIKERLNNLINELSIAKNNNNNDDNILVLNEDSDTNTQCISKKGYKYNSILSEPLEAKIKTDFFMHVKSVINYLKEKTEDDTYKDNNNSDKIIPLEKDKELIKTLIKNVHELNEKKIKKLDKLINAKVVNSDKYKLCEKNNEMNLSKKNNNYLKISPLFEQDNQSLLTCNKFIDYIQKKEKTKFQKFEENKKIFAFAEKFINFKNNKFNNQIEIEKIININYNSNNNTKKDNIDIIAMDGVEKEEELKNELTDFNNYEIVIKGDETEKNIIDDNTEKNQDNFNNINFNNNNSEKNVEIENKYSDNNTIHNKNKENINNIDNIHTNHNININDYIGNSNDIINDNNNNNDKENNVDNSKNDNNNINYNNIAQINNDNDMIIKGKKESPIAYNNNYLVNKEENFNLINQGICCICNNGEWEQNQFLLKCEQCHVTVHQNCYGASSKELYNWVCDACKEMSKEEVYNLECLLCPVLGGAFKKIELPIESTFFKKIMEYKHNKIQLPKKNYNIIIPKSDYYKIPFAWVHLSCALWNPNINLKNYENKTGIFIQNITYEDFNSYCALCKKDNCGPTIKCNNDNCNISYHPECARINNCCLEVEIINKEYQYNVYCYKHNPNLLAKRINYNCQNEIQQVITVNQELNILYDLYKKVYKNDLYQKAKLINQIEIFSDNMHLLKHKRHKSNNLLQNDNNLSSSSSFSSIFKYDNNLRNIIINLSPKKQLSKRGRKKKFFKKIKNNNNCHSNLNLNANKITKSKKYNKVIDDSKNLQSIKIENYNVFNNTIINNIGYGNNINIYVSNYNNMINSNNNFIHKNNKSKTDIKKYRKDLNINNLPTPTIEINKKEFDKIANKNSNNNNNNFEVDEYIKDKKEFIIFLIGFFNDYTLNNRIIIKKKGKKNTNYSIDKKEPIYSLKYNDFKKSDIPWEEIGYNNLSSAILRKAFFAIIPDEKEYKKLFLNQISKSLKDLKNNEKFEGLTIECDNKKKCKGAPLGVYDLLSLNSFKYKILDEKHFFPRTFLCPSCLYNAPNYLNVQKKNKNKKKIININIKK